MTDIELPQTAPIMVLPGATLFPGAIMPLYIFEARYQEMLAWALNHDRMICIAQMRPGVKEARTVKQFFQIAGIGLIRACVAQEDGTSHLMLQGLARVRFIRFPVTVPFRIAEIKRMIEVPAPPGKAEALMVEVRELCTRFRQAGHELPENFESLLATVTDPAKLADAVSHAFVSDSLARQMLLELDNVELRLRALAATLRVELQR